MVNDRLTARRNAAYRAVGVELFPNKRLNVLRERMRQRYHASRTLDTLRDSSTWLSRYCVVKRQLESNRVAHPKRNTMCNVLLEWKDDAWPDDWVHVDEWESHSERVLSEFEQTKLQASKGDITLFNTRFSLHEPPNEFDRFIQHQLDRQWQQEEKEEAERKARKIDVIRFNPKLALQ